MTYGASLWRVPMTYDWDIAYLDEGFLILSLAAEVRARYMVLTDPGIRFMRHVLFAMMERGIPFHIGLKPAAAAQFRPSVILNNACTKSLYDPRVPTPQILPGSMGGSLAAQYTKLLHDVLGKPNAREVIGRRGGVSWITRAYGNITLVQQFLSGPSIQVTVHHRGANDSGDDEPLGLVWDELSDDDYSTIFGYVAGATRAEDGWIYPPEEIMLEYNNHCYREWNPSCEAAFTQIKKELKDDRGRARTHKDWKKFFHSTNHGNKAPKLVVTEALLEDGMQRITDAFHGGSWNKKCISEIPLPETFRDEF
ncbi:hypothetical protein C8J57DRAFT_1090641 [Mycena rebaudengoi]|nr:hypothetical protein C8J57DRAFT_1090641 [Mycena rebaudengoi]